MTRNHKIMTSTGIVFDLLHESKEFVLWATYGEWQSKTHEGFRLACVFEGNFFSWDTWELRMDVHPVYKKYTPTVSEVDCQARKAVIDYLTQHVKFDELMHRAEVTQMHWAQVEGADEPCVMLDQLSGLGNKNPKKSCKQY